MEYVTYNGDGDLTGSYHQEMAPDHEGCHIEVSGEERLNWPAFKANPTRDGLVRLPAAPISAAAANLEILNALAKIDAKSIRPLREGDTARVASLEAEAAALRLLLVKE